MREMTTPQNPAGAGARRLDRQQTERYEPPRAWRTWLDIMLHGERARPLRFIMTGGLAGATQLGLLALLTSRGWPSLDANCAAFLIAAQLNFALSMLFTWRDRCGTGRLYERWLIFHCSIAAMALLNMAVFAAARTRLPDLPAAALGITVAAMGNYLLGDRLVFAGWSLIERLEDQAERVA